MHLFDVEAAEKAEAQIDQFIARRAHERANANKEAEFWSAQECRHQERRREAKRQAWYDHEIHMSELHAALSEGHRVKANILAEQELLGSIATEGEGGHV